MRSAAGAIASSVKPFLPTSISGVQWWLDGADFTTFSFSSVSVISEWRDKSGFNRHVVPPVNNPSLDVINGKGAVLFYPSNRYMWTSSISLLAQPLTTFTVATNNAVMTPGGGRVISSKQEPWFQVIHSEGTQGYRSGAVYAGNWMVGTHDAIVTNDPHMVSAVINSTNSKIWVDGVGGTLLNAGTSDFNLGAIGARHDGVYPLTGKVGEILVYSGAMSDADRLIIENYLKQKWNIL